MKPQECVLGGLRWAFCLRDQSGSCARAGGVLAILLLVPLAVLAADGGAPKKVDPAFELITDDPKLPRVLLMGDSVSIAYTLEVRKALSGLANVHRVPANCGSTKTALGSYGLVRWLGANEKWDVIHFRSWPRKES